MHLSLTLADDGDGGGGALGAGGGELVVLAVDGVGADPDVGDGVHDHLGGVVVLGAADLQLQLLLDHVDAGSDLAREVRVVDAVVDDAVRRLLQRPRTYYLSLEITARHVSWEAQKPSVDCTFMGMAAILLACANPVMSYSMSL